jgi:AcrR family transcriptional regulator
MADLPSRAPWEDVAMAAARAIRADGIANLDLDELAARLKVAPEAVAYWFNDETDVLLSIMQIRQRWFLDQTDARLAPLDSYTEKLGALIDLCVADHDVAYWIELWKLGLRDARARQARQTLRGAYRDQFARLIRAGQRTGEFPATVSADQVALVLVALVVGLSVEATVGDAAKADRMHAVLCGVTERLLEIELSGGDSGAPA